MTMGDAVWTALVAGGTGVLSGAVGWLSARGQQQIELRKLAQDRAPGTARDLRFRQDLYLRHIDSVVLLLGSRCGLSHASCATGSRPRVASGPSRSWP